MHTPLLVGAVGPLPRRDGALMCLIEVKLRKVLHSLDLGNAPLAPAARRVEKIRHVIEFWCVRPHMDEVDILPWRGRDVPVCWRLNHTACCCHGAFHYLESILKLPTNVSKAWTCLRLLCPAPLSELSHAGCSSSWEQGRSLLLDDGLGQPGFRVALPWHFAGQRLPCDDTEGVNLTCSAEFIIKRLRSLVR